MVISPAMPALSTLLTLSPESNGQGCERRFGNELAKSIGGKSKRLLFRWPFDGLLGKAGILGLAEVFDMPGRPLVGIGVPTYDRPASHSQGNVQ